MKHSDGFILYLRKKYFLKPLMIVMVFLVIISGINLSYALTDGPTQPETRRFEYGGLQQLVNPFSGSFAYRIPLFTVGPYPFELTYNSDLTMEQEASWVGLGWNLNTGCINRNMRGYPDDFSRDTVIEEQNQKKNYNVSVNLRVTDLELFSIETPDMAKKIMKKLMNSLAVNSSAGITFLYNNYQGLSVSKEFSLGMNLTCNTLHSLNGKIGFSTGDGGMTISPSLSFDKMRSDNIQKSLFSYAGMGFSFNSLKGIQHLNYGIYNNKLGLTALGNELAFTPYTAFPFRNSSFSFTAKTDFTTTLTDIGISTRLSYAIQKPAIKQLSSPAFGFLYMSGKNGSSGELLDFSREKDHTYIPGNPYLPQTFLQPDIYSVSTALLNEDFRAYHNEAQVVSPPAVYNLSEQTAVDFGLEFGGGNASDIGGNISIYQTSSTQGLWVDKNSAGSGSAVSGFAGTTPFPNVYFKGLSSESRSPMASPSTSAVKFPIAGNHFNYSLAANPAVFSGKYNSFQSVREKRIFQPITKGTFSFHPHYATRYIRYESPAQKPHHIAAVKIKDDSGNTMLFACPAINYLQKDVAFTVEGPGNNNSLLINYGVADASALNDKGMTSFFSSRTVPAYAYAYMLTDFYTSEYADLTGDGPSPDDPGDYVLFSYARKVNRYKWRTPYTRAEYFAAYNPNLRTQKGARSDDIATYSYGEKDIWYVDTVKSKHQIAVFYTSPRRDAREAQGEHGGKGSRSMHKLDSILVYNTHNYYQAKQHFPAPIPDSRIIFKYDYSLCKGVYNQTGNNEGKLTLTEVIITDFNSSMGFRHSYRFNYSHINPAYAPELCDRWGQYDPTSPSGMNNQEFPYTTSADTTFASAWRLNQIQLPSGGTIRVEYEQGNYSYVQDYPAMQMFQLAGVSTDPNTIGNDLNSGNTDSPYYLFFETDLSPGLTLAEAKTKFLKYFNHAVYQNLYFKCFTNISPDASHKEEVFGMAEIEKAELFVHNGKYFGRIKLRGVPIGTRSNSPKINPISKAAIHFGMIHTPRLTFGHADLNQYLDQPMEFLNQFIQQYIINTSAINNLITTIQGPQKKLFHQDVGRYIDASKSFIRLLSASPKPGGGSRVRRVIYDNSWGVMAPGEAGSSLTKEYRYVLENGASSGVATYEPQTGADEIPQHLPFTYNYTTQKHKLANWARNLVPSIDHLGIHPLCETAFPSPSVGYSRVVETTRAANGASDGRIEYQFYTSKDYPTKVFITPLTEKTPTLNLDAVFVKIEKNHCALSQGFTYVNNDMHGKEKQVDYYDGENRNLKSIKNIYSFNGSCKYYHDNNALSSGFAGLEKDVVADFREEFASTTGRDMQLNSNTTLVPLPLAIITLLGGLQLSESVYRSATVTKGIFLHACLVHQEIKDRGADVSVRNVYRDPVTGRPLITNITNGWGAKTWSYDLPACYVYPQMGAASGLTGNYLTVSTNSAGRIASTPPLPLNDGDKLLLLSPAPKFGWVFRLNNIRYLIDAGGQPFSNLSHIKAYVWESGKRNLLNPVVQNISSKDFPDVAGQPLSYNASHTILSASASEYKDFYSYRCAECGCSPSYLFDSIAVFLNAKSPQPVYIPYTIKTPCACDGIITLFPPDSFPLFFYWPNTQQWGVYVQNLCEETQVTMQVHTDTASGPVSTFTFTVPAHSAQNLTLQQVLNPFTYKLKNAWAPSATYVFVSERTPVQVTDPVMLSQQGQYQNFVPFWYYSNGWKNHAPQWLLAEKITHFDFAGNPVESRNIINTYSAATFSHKGSLYESLTTNARSNEVACDAFEDYHPFYLPNSAQPWQHRVLPNVPEHFRLAQNDVQRVSLKKPHTGYYSLEIPTGTTLTKEVQTQFPPDDTLSVTHTSPPFLVQSVHCSDVFAPTPGKKYIVSFWYHKQDTNLTGLQFIINYENAQIQYNVEYVSPVIEGWRQFTCSFDLTGRQCGILSFVLSNHSGNTIYLDDFRVHPYAARMKHYVFNPFTHQLVSVFDENNFALMYQYDALQQVQNTIKETEKGRMFLQYRVKNMFEK